jgi:hypothetical protein
MNEEWQSSRIADLITAANWRNLLRLTLLALIAKA